MILQLSPLEDEVKLMQDVLILEKEQNEFQRKEKMLFLNLELSVRPVEVKAGLI